MAGPLHCLEASKSEPSRSSAFSNHPLIFMPWFQIASLTLSSYKGEIYPLWKIKD